ncbi:hypothetical protein C5S29_11275 [ANME-1 cluster archaeon GoMg3.2]|nr:hypothetical protein [ANME-1 cluster archaeon GoMg3.2]
MTVDITLNMYVKSLFQIKERSDNVEVQIEVLSGDARSSG